MIAETPSGNGLMVLMHINEIMVCDTPTELIHLSAKLGSVLAVVTKGNVICVGSKEIKHLLKK